MQVCLSAVPERARSGFSLPRPRTELRLFPRVRVRVRCLCVYIYVYVLKINTGYIIPCDPAGHLGPAPEHRGLLRGAL